MAPRLKSCSSDSSGSEDTADWPPFDDDSDSQLDRSSGSWYFDVAGVLGAWNSVPLTPQTAQLALDAVRYQRNYARSVTSRLCLHYVNGIRERVASNGLLTFLFSVDGCQSSQAEPSGRCDVYYCRPYTFELQLAQKTLGSDVFVVQSVFKTLAQKPLVELRQPSNLDWSTVPDQIENPLQGEEPVAWQDSVDSFEVPDSTTQQEPPSNDEVAMAWTDDVALSEPITTQQVIAQPLSLRLEPPTSPPERLTETAESKFVAVVGICAVAVGALGFVVAVLLARRRSRATAAKSQQYPPLRSTVITSDSPLPSSRGDEQPELFCLYKPEPFVATLM
ncbi:hypothetical protein BBJ28_00008095 [Nothophytophthora sp. Chile5]|nr:hypothetical protein BBJ28_00008095 [Nothophytophthora sp. Chile5]